MANQESDKSAPKVSKLPLPISDSPLVIDLPDGQKIVVGKMTQGSVIEVATWRGVGRPDSRTSRLMLGMGSGNVNEDSDSDSSQQPGPARPPVSRKPEGFAGALFTLQHFFKNFNRINWSATAKALISSLTSKKSKKNSAPSLSAEDIVAREPQIEPSITVSPVSDDADIEAWLNKISEKAARTTAKSSKPAAKKSPAKKAAVTKKAAPKSAKKR
ncbi:hypothetical protein MCEJIRE27_01055 [Candidatus Nanopelagicaceae bacterium]